MHIFGRLVHIFGNLAHIFGKFVQIFARKLVSRTSKQVSRNLGPLWQPGVYNDTCFFLEKLQKDSQSLATFRHKKIARLSGKGKDTLGVKKSLRFFHLRQKIAIAIAGKSRHLAHSSNSRIPGFGIPGFGISVSGRVPVWVFPTFGIPAFGIPVFGILAFGFPVFGIVTVGILVEFRHPLI